MADSDKLVAIKGLVIRATAVIPEMQSGECYLLETSLSHRSQSVWLTVQPSSDAPSVSTRSSQTSTKARSTSPTGVHGTSAVPRGP